MLHSLPRTNKASRVRLGTDLALMCVTADGVICIAFIDAAKVEWSGSWSSQHLSQCVAGVSGRRKKYGFGH